MPPIEFLTSRLPSRGAVANLYLGLLLSRGWTRGAPHLAQWSAATLTAAGFILIAEVRLVAITPSTEVHLGQFLVDYAPCVALFLFAGSHGRLLQLIASVLYGDDAPSDRPLWARNIQLTRYKFFQLEITLVAILVHTAAAMVIALELLLELSAPVFEPMFDELLMGYAVVVAIMTTVELLRRSCVVASGLLHGRSASA